MERPRCGRRRTGPYPAAGSQHNSFTLWTLGMKRLFENGFPQGKDALLSPQPLFQAGVHSTTILETEGTETPS